MKRRIPTFLLGLGVGILVTASVSVGASNFVKATLLNTKVIVNGSEAKLNDQPISVNGRSYLPLRDTASAMGYSVASASTNKIELVQGGDLQSSKSTTTEQTSTTKTTAVKQGGKTFNVDKYTKGDKLDSEKIAAAIASGELTINSQDAATGKSLLMYVVEKDDYALYQIIHKNALNPNLQDNEGNTALHYVVKYDNSTYMGELKSMKVDPKIKNKNGQRAYDLVTDKNSGVAISLDVYMASREAFK
ncbi:stalk domain-containing protein [Paenibacillus sp. FSL M7-0802]|uniref:stalk domain-containing protein n=1 Tax=Paenibacillus sp. FSL M7-0802 TaxID=2921536 RepID=UPI0030F9CBFC